MRVIHSLHTDVAATAISYCKNKLNKVKGRGFLDSGGFPDTRRRSLQSIFPRPLVFMYEITSTSEHVAHYLKSYHNNIICPSLVIRPHDKRMVWKHGGGGGGGGGG